MPLRYTKNLFILSERNERRKAIFFNINVKILSFLQLECLQKLLTIASYQVKAKNCTEAHILLYFTADLQIRHIRIFRLKVYFMIFIVHLVYKENITNSERWLRYLYDDSLIFHMKFCTIIINYGQYLC